MKRLIFIFIIAFVLNFIWENLHFVLYDNYLGGPVSRFILLQATVADAFLIVLLSLPFLYKNYLLKEGIYSVMDYPAVQLLAKKHSYTPITYGYEKILWLKSKLIASIDQYLFPPHSFILKGMVFGSDKEMPKDLKDQFNVTGLSHVTAVSGSNIVVLISLFIKKNDLIAIIFLNFKVYI